MISILLQILTLYHGKWLLETTPSPLNSLLVESFPCKANTFSVVQVSGDIENEDADQPLIIGEVNLFDDHWPRGTEKQIITRSNSKPKPLLVFQKGAKGKQIMIDKGNNTKASLGMVTQKKAIQMTNTLAWNMRGMNRDIKISEIQVSI